MVVCAELWGFGDVPKGSASQAMRSQMGEEIHSQQRHQIGQAPAEARGHLQVSQQEHRNQRRPDLGLHGIGRGAHERLDLQVLFEGFEEQFNLPPIFIDGGNRTGSQAVVIGEEHQDVANIFANRFNATE